MTFKNKRNLFHTKKRIKRIKRIKRKNSSKYLIGGDPIIYAIISQTTSSYINDNIIEHQNAGIHSSKLENAAKVFQDFIDIKQARSNLEVLNYEDEATPMNSFILSVFKYTEEDPFRYGKICIVKFQDDDSYVFTLSNNQENLKLFRDDLKEIHKTYFATIARAAADNNSHLQFTITL